MHMTPCTVHGTATARQTRQSKKEPDRMATITSPRRLILASGFAAAVAAAPLIATLATPSAAPAPVAAECPGGESTDVFTGNCIPDVVPNSPEPFSATPGNPSLPQVDGIPCTGANSGQCIGLGEEQQAQGPQPVPRSTISSSP
jgi:hypothetical protein